MRAERGNPYKYRYFPYWNLSQNVSIKFSSVLGVRGAFYKKIIDFREISHPAIQTQANKTTNTQ